MKTPLLPDPCTARLLSLLLLVLAMPVAMQAQFDFVTNNGTITITRYTGPGGNVIIPDSINGLPVTSIGLRAFYSCASLTKVTIPDSITSIERSAFETCTSLTGAYFQGNAPSVASYAFQRDNNLTVYYLSGTSGWEATFGTRPTALWWLPNPVILAFPPAFGVLSNGFGFIISWATNASVVVEASTNLAVGTWLPVSTNTVTNTQAYPANPLDGWSYFSDPEWANYLSRFYRVLGAPSNPDLARLVWIPPGTFPMGSPESEPARYGDETLHQVTISRGFWIGKYEVTQGEYLELVGDNPSYFRNGTMPPSGGTGGPVTNELLHPVEQVSWFDATNYCAQLTERERAAGRLPVGYEYRLPTEAQWEYACRAWTQTPFNYGEQLRSGMANFDGHYEYPPCGSDDRWCYNPSGVWLGRTADVGSYAPNVWGLYDMHGNVSEWCLDCYGVYPAEPVTDPVGPAMGSVRVVRGGHCGTYAYAFNCRSASRAKNPPTGKYLYQGFRVALVAVP